MINSKRRKRAPKHISQKSVLWAITRGSGTALASVAATGLFLTWVRGRNADSDAVETGFDKGNLARLSLPIITTEDQKKAQKETDYAKNEHYYKTLFNEELEKKKSLWSYWSLFQKSMECYIKDDKIPRKIKEKIQEGSVKNITSLKKIINDWYDEKYREYRSTYSFMDNFLVSSKHAEYTYL